MDRLIYLALSGAQATLQRQDVLANNLANASTPGFRAEMQALRAVPVQGDGASTRVFTLETTTGFDSRSGPVQGTGRALDVALLGQAWLTVLGADGQAAHTRAGSLELDAQGQLVTTTGWPVLGESGPISVPQGSAVEIAADGTVYAQSAGVGSAKGQVLGRLKLVNGGAGLNRGADGLFRPATGELPTDPQARLQAGALEGSNVSPVETMVQMIAAARQFEQQMKLLQGAEQREQSASKLLAAQ